jgi:hypothetical protein
MNIKMANNVPPERDIEVIHADTFMELLSKLETWKMDNDNYDSLAITIIKQKNVYLYKAFIIFHPCYEIE